MRRDEGWIIGEPYEPPGNFFRGVLCALAAALFLALIFFAGVLAGRAWGEEAKKWDVRLAWDPNTEPDLAGYRLYENGVQVAEIPAGTETVTRVVGAGSYSWYLTAYDTSENESAPSNTVTWTLDEQPPGSPHLHIPGVCTHK